jgi:hypothetical protein
MPKVPRAVIERRGPIGRRASPAPDLFGGAQTASAQRSGDGRLGAARSSHPLAGVLTGSSKAQSCIRIHQTTLTESDKSTADREARGQ